MKFQAIIFDCFGVLYVDETKAYFDQFPEHAKELHDLNKACDQGFISRQAYTEGISAITGEPVKAVQAAFRRELVPNKPLLHYIQDSLKPHYKIGLLSNIGRDWIDDYFSEATRRNLFDAIVLSSEEGVLKPDPVIFQRITERLNVAPRECIMVDDRVVNCQAAKSIGMQCIEYKDVSSFKTELSHLLQ